MKPAPDFQSLYGELPDKNGSPTADELAPEEIPEPYRTLLVHNHHMTVTVEDFYRDRVDVAILESQLLGHEYRRKILLALTGNSRVVQFGLVCIDLSLLSSVVREQIIAGKTPLGRILIENDVLREVRPISYWKVQPNDALRDWFQMTHDEDLYGRIGLITTDGQPAIEVLEILAPIPRSPD